MSRPLARALLVLLFSLPLLAKAEWLHARTEHFEVFSSAKRGYTEELVQGLEDIQQVFRSLFVQNPRYSVRTLVIYCGNERDLRPFEREFKGQLVEIGGLYVGPSEYPSLVIADGWSGDDTRKAVYHEMGHLLIEAVIPDIPLWANEGFAQVFETVEIDRSEFLVGEPDPDTLSLLRSHSLMPMRTLLETGAQSKLYNTDHRRDAFYAQSWAFVHMCNFSVDKSLREKLFTYIVAQRGQVDKVACMEKAFGCSIETLDRQLETFLRNGGYILPKGVLPPDHKVTVEFLPCGPAELEAARRSVLQRIHGGDTPRAEALSAFMNLDQSEDAFLCTLAALQSRSLGDTELALNMAERAFKLGSLHPELLAFRLAKDIDPLPREITYRMPEEMAAGFRERLDQALAAAPGHPELLRLLAYVEAFAPRTRPEKLKLLEAASRKLEHRDSVYLMMAYIRWRYGDAATAGKILQAMSAEGRRQGMARSLSTMLEQGKPWKQYL
jgi:hypothetical protein